MNDRKGSRCRQHSRIPPYTPAVPRISSRGELLLPTKTTTARHNNPKRQIQQNSPEGRKVANNVHPGDASYPPLVLGHEEHLLPRLGHVVGVHRDLLEHVRLDVRIQGSVNLLATIHTIKENKTDDDTRATPAPKISSSSSSSSGTSHTCVRRLANEQTVHVCSHDHAELGRHMYETLEIMSLILSGCA